MHLHRNAAALAAVAGTLTWLIVLAPLAHGKPQGHGRTAHRWHAGTVPAVGVVQTSASMRQRLTTLPALPFTAEPPRGIPTVHVDDTVRYQRYAGVGAAMTDTSAWLIYEELPVQARNALIGLLFGSAGIHLNIVRVPIGASDFTATETPYSYDDLPAGQSDLPLTQFSIAHDLPYVIPALQQALQVNPGLKLLASPWSPPAWMKGNQSPGNVNSQGVLLTSAYGAWAQYIVKFLQAYTAAGVPIAAVTPQNEPGAPMSYPGMQLTVDQEAALISQYLAPALARAGLATRIYGFDFNWDLAYFANALAQSPAAGALAGIAWHCYAGSPGEMSSFHNAFPALDQIVSECSTRSDASSTAELLISSFRNWASAVILWNLALDPSGGPVQPPNQGCPRCTGVVTVSEHTRTFTPLLKYYQLGQVSKFLAPGAVRVKADSFVSYGATPSRKETISAGVDDVAFENPDGSKVLVAYNNTGASLRFAVAWRGRAFSYTLAGHAMVTFRWR